MPNIPNPVKDIKKNEPAEEHTDIKSLRAFEIQKLEIEKKSERKLKRLSILQGTLWGVGGGFIISISTTIYIISQGNITPPELIVANTVLGSTLTTIIGVIAGTSID